MILARGNIYDSEKQDNILAQMEEEIAQTIVSRRLPAGIVMRR